ncbi:MAG: hypothetical protein AAF591_23760 [Verrucomicrobiota bacterium]
MTFSGRQFFFCILMAGPLLVLVVGVPRVMGQSAPPLTGYTTGSARASSMNSDPGLPQVFAPVQPRTTYTRYPWKHSITSTVFWIGEKAAGRNTVANLKSSWDVNWMQNYGGYDDPNPSNRTVDYRPKGFIPRQNPFYVALPYKDTIGWAKTKPEAKLVIPWFDKEFEKEGRSVCWGRWVAIRKGGKVCYAQWEDCGPWTTDDYHYVFGNARPKNRENSGAWIDLSPAVRDYLGLGGTDKVDWRFVDLEEIPYGPWSKYGDNNDFIHLVQERAKLEQEKMERLRKLRDEWYLKQPPQR